VSADFCRATNESMFCSNKAHDTILKLHRLYLQNDTSKIEGLKTQQRNEIAQLSAENTSLKKKCDKFKDMIKSLNDKNRAWEDSYKAQSDDLMSHGMEITRLNGQLEGFKRVLNSSERGSDRFMNRQLHLQTPQEGRTHMGYPETM
jgi:chromosome segregation ATPase